MSQMSRFDPSTPNPGEDQTTYAETERRVSDAYEVALGELDVLVKMVSEVAKPPKNDDLEQLKQFRDTVSKDVWRLGMRLEISKKYFRACEKEFHYFATRLRTTDRVTRLRLLEREKNERLEAVRLQSGDAARAKALKPFEERKRVLIQCYELGELWGEALRAEKDGDELSGDCDTSTETGSIPIGFVRTSWL
ncbi:Fc.00g059450.m01.CDS01 [Cosmosporella sp. VM-42]